MHIFKKCNNIVSLLSIEQLYRWQGFPEWRDFVYMLYVLRRDLCNKNKYNLLTNGCHFVNLIKGFGR
jgi:hypothetical protein